MSNDNKKKGNTKDTSITINGKKRLKTKLKELKNSPLTATVDPTNKPVVSTKAEVDNRVNEVANLLTVGYTRTYILKYGSKWAVSDRTIDAYISAAWKVIKEINELTLQDNMSMITNQLWDLYRAARADNDYNAANNALKQLAKIKGLEVNTINHIIEDNRDLEGLSNEQLDELLNNHEELQ